MPTIKIDLSSAGIDDAIRRLEKCKRYYQRKMEDVIERLAQKGLSVMNVTYNTVAYPGTNDVDVRCEFYGDHVLIIAEGYALPFIEFGAGIRYPEGDYSETAGALHHGEYGLLQGANPNGWYYEGEGGQGGLATYAESGKWHTYGNPPANAFTKTVDEIKNSVEDTVRSVFGG